MKINYLSKREDYKLIIYNTLVKYLQDQNIDLVNISLIRYYINKRLNIIFSDETPDELFYKSVSEYRHNKGIIKATFQLLYVKIVSIKYFRKLFSDDFIYLPCFFSSFSIIGGNHRIRLLNIENSQFLVLLKIGESRRFIHNEFNVRSLNQIDYLPFIKYELCNDWFYESYVSGIPFNRIYLSRQKKIKYLSDLFLLHNSKLIIPTKEKICIKEYLATIQMDITNIINNGNFKLEIFPILNQMFLELDKCFQHSNFDIFTSYTHGDFQEGNLRIQNDRLIVIDWESSDRRFFLYDFFVLFGNPRHDFFLLNSYNKFIEKMLFFDNISSEIINEYSKVLLFLEELKFYSCEENSLNYNKFPNRCKEIILQLISILGLMNFNKYQER